MSRFWKILVIITCLLSVIAIFISFRINIEFVSVEGADILAWSVGILQISIAVIAILFAYNVISFEKRVKTKIQEAENKLQAEFRDEIKRIELETVASLAVVQADAFSILEKPFEASLFYFEFLRRMPKGMVLNKGEVEKIQNALYELEECEFEISSYRKEEWLKILYRVDIEDIEDLISSVKSLKTYD